MTDFPSEHGLCDVCEKMPASPDEPICALCRVEITAASEIVTDPVELILNAHWHVCFIGHDAGFVLCRCLARFDGPGYHRRHVAELIREALGLDPPAPWTPASEAPPGDDW